MLLIHGLNEHATNTVLDLRCNGKHKSRLPGAHLGWGVGWGDTGMDLGLLTFTPSRAGCFGREAGSAPSCLFVFCMLVFVGLPECVHSVHAPSFVHACPVCVSIMAALAYV